MLLLSCWPLYLTKVYYTNKYTLVNIQRHLQQLTAAAATTTVDGQHKKLASKNCIGCVIYLSVCQSRCPPARRCDCRCVCVCVYRCVCRHFVLYCCWCARVIDDKSRVAYKFQMISSRNYRWPSSANWGGVTDDICMDPKTIYAGNVIKCQTRE